ncbi:MULTISPECIES: hypothetical protein [unclassified Nesterenkonia]|uniref:hypothetical protein n=1 Tax=unclassified Nesterenkonia TaxID=2629769 RepID=UPI001F4CAFDD|nr:MULTISPECIES: hypothetical protein [unclassified Nesterenkonia]MCH8560800.1 hypothetical protein [Nesterenkonia sp. DZ6]MCH8563591.1 hypothetical protein [Nesterenkonia sp. YGD6]
MDTTLIQTFNAFFLAAVVLAVPVLILAGIWTATVELRRPVPATVEIPAGSRAVHQP